MDKKALHKLSYGLYLVTAVDSTGRKVGCIANTFQQVASKPPLVSISLNKENATTEAIQQSGSYGVMVLSESADMEFIGTFGFKSSRDIDKFAGLPCTVDEAGIAYVNKHSVAHFTVRVTQKVDANTHIMFVGEVEKADVVTDSEKPMTYAYYHDVLKGLTPPKAATYETDTADAAAEAVADKVEELNAEAAAEGEPPKYAWRCMICGHIEYVDELPADFRCPICGVGPECFERIEL